VVGNSLLLRGIDRARLQRAMGSRYHVALYPIEGTTYLDWYFGLRHLFADGARPSMLVLCISVRQLVYDQTAGEGFAHTMMSIADLPAVVRASHLDMMTASAYFFANRSAWLGGRSSLHNGLLERWLPNASTLARFLTVRDPASLSADPATISRALQRLGDAASLCGSYGARFVFLVPPSLNPSDPAEAVRSAAELTGLPVLVPYRSGEMPGAAFSDGFHLNPDGAVLFTDRAATALLVVAAAGQESAPASDRGALRQGHARTYSGAIRAIQAQRWPSNVREPENRVKGTVTIAHGTVLTANNRGLENP